MPDSLKLKFGMHVLKVISKKNSIGEFVLYIRDFVFCNWTGSREELVLNKMLTRLTADESSRFSFGDYDEFEYEGDDNYYSFPCIHLSSSSEY